MAKRIVKKSVKQARLLERRLSDIISNMKFKRINYLNILFCLPIIAYFFVVLQTTHNIPIWDDYDCTLPFLLKFFNSVSLWDKFLSLIEKSNENMIFIQKILFVLTVKIFGSINFKVVAYLGNLALIFNAFILIKHADLKEKWLALAFVFLLFQIQYWEIINFAFPAFGIHWTNFFILLSLIFLVKNPPVCLGFAVLSCLTSSRGYFFFVVMLLFFLFKKDKKIFIIWGLSFVALLALAMFSSSSDGKNPFLFLPGNIINYFFVLLGSPLSMKKISLAYMCGIGIFSYFIYLIKIKFYQKNIFLFLYISYLMLTLAGITFLRSENGIEHAFASRYKINTLLLISTCYLTLPNLNAKLYRNKLIFLKISLLACILLNIASYFLCYPKISAQSRKLKQGMILFEENKLDLYYSDQEKAGKVLQECIEQKLYVIP